MTERTEVELSSLVGEHMLDAVDMETESVERYADCFEDAEVIRFRLDGVTYVGIEDPSDGYRSSLGTLHVSPDAQIKNAFPPVKVLGLMKDHGEYGRKNDTLQLIDVVTGKVVLEVGTDNTDDYYPWFVGMFDPTAMVSNEGKP